VIATAAAFSIFVLLVSCAVARLRGCSWVKTVLSRVDSLSRVDPNPMGPQPPLRRPSPLGGGCSVLSHTLVVALAALLVIQHSEDHVQYEYSEEPVTDGLITRAGALGWAAAVAPAPAGGVTLRVFARGCAGGVASLAWDGLAAGAWTAAAPLACPQRNATLLLLKCERCFFTEGAELRFALPSDCSALQLEVLSGGADGALHVLTFPNATALDVGAGGGTLGGLAISWGPRVVLETRNERTSAPLWGWHLLRGPAAAARRGIATEPVTVSLGLPLWPTLKAVTLVPLRSDLELVSELSGLLTIYTVFAILYWAFEEARGACPIKPSKCLRNFAGSEPPARKETQKVVDNPSLEW
jgi:hypothetical protein